MSKTRTKSTTTAGENISRLCESLGTLLAELDSDSNGKSRDLLQSSFTQDKAKSFQELKRKLAEFS